MLEPLISSRIRRALLEYLLTHPTDRFYLRGLSKELGLSVSPLRRELKRLERSGMLTAIPEGNMLFYAVKTSSPAFQQLMAFRVEGSGLGATAPNPKPITPSLVTVPHSIVRRHPLRIPLLIGAATGFLIAVGSVAVILSRRVALRQPSASAIQQRANVTVVMPPPSASGAMRGARWQLVPGGFGSGFGTASNERRETY